MEPACDGQAVQPQAGRRWAGSWGEGACLGLNKPAVLPLPSPTALQPPHQC